MQDIQYTTAVQFGFQRYCTHYCSTPQTTSSIQSMLLYELYDTIRNHVLQGAPLQEASTSYEGFIHSLVLEYLTGSKC